jgi:hypothetical protein
MGKVVVFTSLTLDGVMQAPGRPDEDRRGGPPAELRLVDTVTTTTGVVIATYHTERSQA